MVRTIGERIRQLRLAKKMTQAELAQVLQISLKSIQRFERNLYTPDVHNLILISTFFDVSVDYLLGLYDARKSALPIEENALPNTMYKAMYERYILCRQQSPIDGNTYYWISSFTNNNGKEMLGGQTQWAGWADDKRKKELRKLREVNPDMAIKSCTRVYGAPLILHTLQDVEVFLLYGGQAIVEKHCCEKYLPNFLKPFLVDKKEVKWAI
ncbi:helix-turn-helix transcriptional regulator [Clostridium sp. 19966]|uniref:helix-turn-helix domain-containing protein n=1 Tax=Clostridium sp. 19966 TaxID=2768166 RepID=UPI0028E0374A|nr:helix-turn-helix transcriptional regulator [Clostridium sp. 19966]MDT8719739.1 helix-turn-helix transcriptional regulator [Clostridium sp. 19966]